MITPSASGVSITRSAPNSSCRPLVALKTPPITPTSSPRMNTRSSRRISSASALVIASIYVESAIGSWVSLLFAGWGRCAARPCLAVQFAFADAERIHVIERLFRLRIRRVLGELHRFLDLLVDRCQLLSLELIGPHVVLGEIPLHRRDRVLRLPLFHFFRRAILGGIDLRVSVPAVGLGFDQRRTIADA